MVYIDNQMLLWIIMIIYQFFFLINITIASNNNNNNNIASIDYYQSLSIQQLLTISSTTIINSKNNTLNHKTKNRNKKYESKLFCYRMKKTNFQEISHYRTKWKNKNEKFHKFISIHS